MGNAVGVTFTWNGKSNLEPSASPVILEIYNFNSLAWEVLATENLSGADVDFTMVGSKINMANYKDGSLLSCCRVYQLGRIE